MTGLNVGAVVGGLAGGLAGFLLAWMAFTQTGGVFLVIAAAYGLGMWSGVMTAAEFPRLAEWARWK